MILGLSRFQEVSLYKPDLKENEVDIRPYFLESINPEVSLIIPPMFSTNLRKNKNPYHKFFNESKYYKSLFTFAKADRTLGTYFKAYIYIALIIHCRRDRRIQDSTMG